MNAYGIAIVAGAVTLLGWLWLTRVLARSQTHKTVEKLLRNPEKTNLRVLENSKNGTLVAEPTGFRITTPSGQSAELLWEDIEEIDAFKRDLLTTDLICLVFKKLSKDEHYEIHEEMAGYHDLLEAMKKYLPEFNLAGFVDIAFPAFATNHRVIWRRSTLATSGMGSTARS